MSTEAHEQRDGLGILAGALLVSVLLHGLLLRTGGLGSHVELPRPAAIEIELTPPPAGLARRAPVVAPRPAPKPVVRPRRVVVPPMVLPKPVPQPRPKASASRPAMPKARPMPVRTARLPGELRSEAPSLPAPGNRSAQAPSLRASAGAPDLSRPTPTAEPQPAAVRNAEAPETSRPTGLSGGLPRLGGPRGVTANLDLPRVSLGGDPDGKGVTGGGAASSGKDGAGASGKGEVAGNGGGTGKPGAGSVAVPLPKPEERPPVVPRPVVRDPAPKPKPEPVRPPDLPEPEVVLTRARYRSNPPPSYPDEARRQKQEGVVLLRVVVNEKGKVESADLLRTSGFDSLDDAALRGIRRWTFEPARRGDMPVQSTVNVPVRFKLD